MSQDEISDMETLRRTLRDGIVAVVAAILVAGRCEPSGGTVIDPETLVNDARAIVNAAQEPE